MSHEQLRTALAGIKSEREKKIYFPQYYKIYVALNDSNRTKWRVAGKAQGPS